MHNAMRLAGILVVLSLVASAASARDIYVSVAGSDGNSGGPSDPYRHIKYAISQSAYGDTIYVRAGTYAESWITPKAGTELVSVDGLHAAKIYSGNSSAIRLTNDNCGINGFEIYGNWNQGSPGDGLIRPLWSNNVWIKNCLVHDAPYDQDCIKVGANNVLIENCIVYNPAHRTDGVSYQEVVDVYGTPAPDGVTIRHSWLYLTPDKKGDYITYAKGGSRNILWEYNIFGPDYSGPSSNPSTSAGGPSPAVFPSCENFVARNNLFLYCSGDGAFALLSARNVEFYNNIIWNYHGARAAIEFYTTGVGTNENFYFYNNIIYNTNGRVAFSDRGYMPAVFEHDNNIYYQVAGGGSVNIYAEPNSLFVNPMLASPAIPVGGVDTWDTIVAKFELLDGSPAIEAGRNLGAVVPDDIYQTARPVGPNYDIGAYEFVIPGDVDADGQVNVFDAIAVVNAFGSQPGDPNWDPQADFDGNGQVDVFDAITLVNNFGRSL